MEGKQQQQGFLEEKRAELIAFKDQGDESMYTREMLKQRGKLRHDREIVDLITLFWELLDPTKVGRYCEILQTARKDEHVPTSTTSIRDAFFSCCVFVVFLFSEKADIKHGMPKSEYVRLHLAMNKALNPGFKIAPAITLANSVRTHKDTHPHAIRCDTIRYARTGGRITKGATTA